MFVSAEKQQKARMPELLAARTATTGPREAAAARFLQGGPGSSLGQVVSSRLLVGARASRLGEEWRKAEIWSDSESEETDDLEKPEECWVSRGKAGQSQKRTLDIQSLLLKFELNRGSIDSEMHQNAKNQY